MYNKLKEKSVIRLSIIFFVSLLLTVLLSCEDSNTSDIGKVEYSLKNTSKIALGFKLHLKANVNSTKITDSVVIEPGEDIVAVKSHQPDAPDSVVSDIEIWDSQFKVKYKNHDCSDYLKEGERFTWPIWMPNPNAADITKSNVSVHLYYEQNPLFGFYPKVEYPRVTNFFYTGNFFDTRTTVQLPDMQPNAEIKMAAIIGSLLFAYDASGYTENVRFIASYDRGKTWSNLLDLNLGTVSHFLTAATFVDEGKGWMFNYRMVFNGQSANTYATEVYRYRYSNPVDKISTINGYCVQTVKFTDENTGYVLANTSDNVTPSTATNTYLLKTTDGGRTWSPGVEISNRYLASKFFKLENGNLIVFGVPTAEPLRKEYFISRDDGLTWETKQVSVEDGIRDFQMLENGIGFLKTGTNALWSMENIGNLYKTTDGGATWTVLKKGINGSKISFFDETYGFLQDLIYGKGQILYVTDNGGKTWRELLYPYDYMIK